MNRLPVCMRVVMSLGLSCLYACYPLIEAEQYGVRTGRCGPICKAAANVLGEQVGPRTVTMAEFNAVVAAKNKADKTRQLAQRQIDLSSSQLPGIGRTQMLEQTGPPMAIMKDDTLSCDAFNFDPRVEGCAAGHDPPCPEVIELRRALRDPQFFHVIYSDSAPAGAPCTSAAQCDPHIIMICYGADDKLRSVMEWNTE